MSNGDPIYLAAAVEGDVDEVVLRRVASAHGAALHAVYGKNGKDHLLRRLRGYNHAARHAPWIVLVDLDRDADCAPPYKQQVLPDPAPQMLLRIVVRAIESWLFADGEALADYQRVQRRHVPQPPEQVEYPKREMVNLARNSTSREIREDMVPRPESGRNVGPAYSSRLIEFARLHWRPEMAAQEASSLRKCQLRISELNQ